ncbi:IDEAL domain-containing protein [Paenibacillus sophorae]|uniref:IDEAL domain-containing protein n=1 Tax=Paenibacillus sophorae TaxID=1333845 RepID=A0A1H8GEP9_9BACL|nr:IDEAL domain-containing protein [Paenibacillus sophorae]QWU14198.1 IDEAL domain-containing protein [Paenibacillus sophorae]SEN42482.1 IDEAL domain-containing protein [Paenibacillus sophorae]
MIMLNKEQVFNLIKDGITQVDKQTPTDIKLSIDPIMFKYDKSTDEWYYHTKDFTKNIIRYTMLGAYYTESHRYASLQGLTYFLKKEFPEHSDIKIDIRAKDSDFRKYSGKEKENLMDAVNISVQIYHDDKVNLKDDELRNLIDYSLIIKDKEWFNELVEQYNK